MEEKPDSLQKELAAHFKVSVNAISRALKQLGIVRKKTRYVTGKAGRMKSSDGVRKEHAWTVPGKRVFRYVDGNRRKRTSLLGGYLNRRGSFALAVGQNLAIL